MKTTFSSGLTSFLATFAKFILTSLVLISIASLVGFQVYIAYLAFAAGIIRTA